MSFIADLLDKSKACANIESDYRLSKVLRINQSALSNYRHGRSLPNVEIIEALCALSGDDAGLVVAQVEAMRAQEGPVRNMWLSVAKRLAGGASTAILSVLFLLGLVSTLPDSARASTVAHAHKAPLNNLYIVLSTILSVHSFLLVRLRQTRRHFPAFFRLCFLASV